MASSRKDDLPREFQHRYWRSAPLLDGTLAPLAAEQIPESQFKLAADNIPVLCWMANGDGYIVWYNRRWYEYAGTSAAEMEGWGWQAVHDPEVLPEVMERWTGSIATGEPFEMTFPLKGADGVFRPFLTRVQPVRDASGSVVRWFGVNTEISAQLTAENAKRESEERLRLVLDAAPGGFYAVDREGNTNLVSRGFLDLLGFEDEQDALGRKLHDVIHHTKPDGAHYPVEECPIYLCASTGKPSHVSEESFFRLDGAAVPVEYWATPIHRNGEHIGAICTVIDLREVKQADAALREESRTLETLNRTGSAIAAELDLERLVQMVTDAGVELTGAQFGAFFYNVLDPAGEKYLLYALSGAERADFDRFGMPRATAIFHPTFVGEGVVRSDDITKDERYGKNDPHHGMPEGHLPVRSYLAVPVISRSEEVIGGLFFGHPGVARFTARHERLITGVAAQAAVGIDNARLYDTAQKELAERVRAETALRELNETLEERVREEVERRSEAEEALRQAQKMEAVGQLTGGIAHDFNNLLTGVIGSLDMMQRQISKGETGKIERYATTAMTAANRAAALTHRLLAFSRRQPLHPKPVDANRLVTGMEELLRRTLGESIALEIVTAGGLWQTLCDPHQLESAVLNLAINARDAMPDGGSLTIETCNTRLDSTYAAKQRDVSPGQYVCICVTDTGSGMSKDTMEKAFEPFFTTKPIGQGTGLGLSMIYGFTRQSEGYARIYSELGRGTTIKLYLPRYYGEAEVVAEEQGQLTDAHRAEAGEVVLVIEDDATVRDLVVDVLGELGYRAIEAADGPSGLKLLQSGMHLDLLITDIGLPGLNGRQVVDATRQQRPDLKVLFMTGYAENATIANGFLEPGMEMITKPFAIEALATRIRGMIAG